ncbi:thymidine phosphorylase [Acidipila rosea]|uniref:thymidine phosphorylase n=1 Tax=Acidipila rosea TaxID=768535 RepID=A0A4R1KZ10_9BACT|nr:thymidine phosphorylase [Acidipila rosea]TCK70788.1 pyrimidine-nucleoside phosphorylase [Acidipila rosea]
MHPVDLIRKTRDGEPLSHAEIEFLVEGAARETIPVEQLAAWLMAVFHRGLAPNELATLTAAMRDSGSKFDPSRLGGVSVDKHSTGGVGDKTSFMVAPIVAAAGLVDPMISGRALGHTGGTLDKLESIPGYRTSLSPEEMKRVLAHCGACIVGQTANLVPADRILYALRDRTATVESPYLICASIMSKKLAAGLDALVLDVKTGTGAFLQDQEQALFLAALMVDTGERAGTRTAALLTDMNQPLGCFAGNWVEIAEAVAMLRNERHPLNEDLRELSLTLAGWMLHLGGQADGPETGYAVAETLLVGGKAHSIFLEMVRAQGGDVRVFDHVASFHAPKARREYIANREGYLSYVDCTAVGWAVQRLGAGRERVGEPVDPHAGIEMHAKLGSHLGAGQPLLTLFGSSEDHIEEAVSILSRAFVIEDMPRASQPLIKQIITAENRIQFLEKPLRP